MRLLNWGRGARLLRNSLRKPLRLPYHEFESIVINDLPLLRIVSISVHDRRYDQRQRGCVSGCQRLVISPLPSSSRAPTYLARDFPYPPLYHCRFAIPRRCFLRRPHLRLQLPRCSRPPLPDSSVSIAPLFVACPRGSARRLQGQVVATTTAGRVVWTPGLRREECDCGRFCCAVRRGLQRLRAVDGGYARAVVGGRRDCDDEGS